MTVESAKALLPNIGDKMNGGTVVEVNRNHLWYRVQKLLGGIKISECYKIPNRSYMPIIKTRDTSNWTINGQKKMVRCVNTGRVFRNCESAGKEYGLSKDRVQRSARKGEKVGEGYYLFEYIPFKEGLAYV